MKNDNYEVYRPYLQPEMRVEIGIPLSEGGVFRDWAVIGEASGDLLLVEISRDMLPHNVRIDVGFILDVNITIKEDVYTCGAIVTEKTGKRLLRVQLFGSFNIREKRQFFRIDLNLKIKYALVTDEDKSQIEVDWQRRRDLEHLKYQGMDEFALAVERARLPQPRAREWREMLRSEVNLGGGGIGIRLPEAVYKEQFICLEISIPFTPPRLVQAVAQVLMVKPPTEQKGRRATFEAGMQFLFLDDKDRELIFQHISVSQLEHLRKIADKRDLEEDVERTLSRQERRRRIVTRVVWAVIFLVVVYYLVDYFTYYSEVHPKNEIGSTYEKAIKKYRHVDE